MEQLTIEQQQLVSENERLVHYFIRREFKVTPRNELYEEYYLVGIESLCQAAQKFDKSRNIKFSTFAYSFIVHNILKYIRKIKKYKKNISMNKPIFKDSEITLGEIIPARDIDVESDCIDAISVEIVLEYLLNELPSKIQIVILCWLARKTQMEIVKILNCSQAQTSRNLNKGINLIKEKLSQDYQQHKGGIHVALENGDYKITFVTCDTVNFSIVFSELMKSFSQKDNLVSRSEFKLPDFRINCNKERAILYLPNCPESFLFIAELVQKIESYKINYIAEKEFGEKEITEKEITEKEIAEQEITEGYTQKTFDEKTNNKALENVAKPDEENLDLSTTTNRNSKRGQIKRQSNSGKVKLYILSLKEEFTAKSVMEHFKNEIKSKDVYNAINSLKSQGKIRTLARGRYSVK